MTDCDDCYSPSLSSSLYESPFSQTRLAWLLEGMVLPGLAPFSTVLDTFKPCLQGGFQFSVLDSWSLALLCFDLRSRCWVARILEFLDPMCCVAVPTTTPLPKPYKQLSRKWEGAHASPSPAPGGRARNILLLRVFGVSLNPKPSNRSPKAFQWWFIPNLKLQVF